MRHWQLASAFADSATGELVAMELLPGCTSFATHTQAQQHLALRLKAVHCCQPLQTQLRESAGHEKELTHFFKAHSSFASDVCACRLCLSSAVSVRAAGARASK